METKKYEIFGIGFDELKDVDDLFNTNDCYDEEEVIYSSNKTFHHDDEDGLCFDYKYIIDCIYCEGKRYYQLCLAVLPKSCCKDYIDGVMDFCGVDSIDDLTFNDIVAYGGSTITFGTISEDEDYDDELNKDTLDKIASVFEVMDSMRGFYIDKPWNRIGTNGLDTLNYCVNGEKLF